jgi:hypothetical protein
MARGFVHAALDLIAFGRTYAPIHKTKDAFALRVPGLRHREIGHDWYQNFGRGWDFDDPFPESRRKDIRQILLHRGPDFSEEAMASDAHDLLDRTWDNLSKPDREFWEGFFVWLLYRPGLLESWAGVDVLRGRVARVIDGKEVWENSPEIVSEYRDLRRRVSRNHKHRLQKALAVFGA